MANGKKIIQVCSKWGLTPLTVLVIVRRLTTLEWKTKTENTILDVNADERDALDFEGDLLLLR